MAVANCLRRRKYAAVMGKLHEIAAFSKPASLIPRGVMMVVPLVQQNLKLFAFDFHFELAAVLK